MTAPAADAVSPPPAPAAPLLLAPLGRRLSSLLYELVLLFGLMLVPAALGLLLRNDTAMQVFSFVFFAIYFVWFWTTRGQTLPMQTWRIRLVRADGAPVGQGRALARYLAAFVGYLGPAFVVNHALDVHRGRALWLYGAGAICWALLALLDRDRQFWHDRLCGTRLIDARNEPRGAARTRV